jgi:acyl carrier protein
MDSENIKAIVKEFILAEFLPGEKPEALEGGTELITQGILDSLATLKLVAFLEQKFDITIAPHEADAEYLNTIDDITRLVDQKAV